MQSSFCNTLWTINADGPPLSAAAAATMLPASPGKYTLPATLLGPLSQIWWRAQGRISCAVTTPGTARYDLRAGATVIFDTLAMNLNVVAQTTDLWTLDVCMQVRGWGSGTATTLMGLGHWMSAAGVGVSAPTVNTSAIFGVPYNTAPVVGGGWDFTISNVIDSFFTQTVATGSMTLHNWWLGLVN